jgi:amidase
VNPGDWRSANRSTKPPYASGEEARNSPDFQKVIKGSREHWNCIGPATAHYEYLKARYELMTNVLNVMADHKLEGIIHKAIEHQPTLIKDGVNPPCVDQKDAPHLDTFLVFISSIAVPAGITFDNLPGHHFSRATT